VSESQTKGFYNKKIAEVVTERRIRFAGHVLNFL